MADFLLLEQLHNMMTAVPRPRLFHKKGMEVKGFFKPYMSFSDYTEAELFSGSSDGFPVKARFSVMLGEKGVADTVRNIKGLSVRFYTGEGEYDLICQSLPVFFINSPELFIPLRDALTKEESFDGIDCENFWRFVVEHPEAVNCALRLFSHEGLSASYITMIWHSVNTYVWQNAGGKKSLVRYRWSPVESSAPRARSAARRLDRVSAEFLAGFSPDAAGEELRRAISTGDFPAYELEVQIIDYRLASYPEYGKRTICWNERLHPFMAAGIMKLTDMAGYGESTEGECYAPGNAVRGISVYEDEFSRVMDYAHKTGGSLRGAMQ